MSYAQAFWDVFGETKLKTLLPELYIPVSFWIDKNGKVLELSYVLDKNTLITPVELEKLEQNLLKNLSFNLHPEDIVKGDYFLMVINNSFQKILDKKALINIKH